MEWLMYNLVGGWATPLTNMKVSWDDEIPNIWEKYNSWSTPPTRNGWWLVKWLVDPNRTEYIYNYIYIHVYIKITELDDGKILTGNPYIYLMVKTMVSGVDFPQQTNPLTDFTGNHAVGCCLVFDMTSCFPHDLVSAAASTSMKSQSAVTDQDHGLQNCEVRRGKRNACPWSQWLLLLGPSLSEVGPIENGLSPAKCTRNSENVGNPLPYAQTQPRWLSHFDFQRCFHTEIFKMGCQPSTKVRWIVSLCNIIIHDSWENYFKYYISLGGSVSAIVTHPWEDRSHLRNNGNLDSSSSSHPNVEFRI